MSPFECWWVIPEWNMTLGLPPRCGSSTVLHYLQAEGILAYRPTEFTGRCTFVVRDPVDRFVSLWRAKCRDRNLLTVDDTDSPIIDMTPTELIEFIETTDIQNPHWATLTEIEAGGSTERLPIEKLHTFVGDAPHYNGSTGDVLLGENLLMRVQAHYADDYELI